MSILEKIGKSNSIMAAVAVVTLGIVAYVLIYKPWKTKQEVVH